MRQTPKESSFCCRFCGGNEATEIITYKHIWLSCNNCRNIVRNLRDRFPLEFIPRWVQWLFGRFDSKNSLNPREIRSKLYYVLGHWEKGNIYDYYLDEDQSIRGGYNLSSKGTKWEGESEYVQDELNGWGVLLKDKKVIEISGGPGYFAKELSPVSRKWVVTEYSQVSAERMRNILGLEAIKFDFNSDDLSKIVDDTFDIVLLRHCINFCSDIRKFLGSIKRVIHKDTVIYCSFTQPTFASCLRWSVDDYTFPILYHPETIQKLFAEEGFIAFGKKEQGTRHWIYGGYWMTGGVHWGHVMTSPVTIPYYFLNRFKNIDVSTREKNLAMIFRKNPDARW